MCSCSGSGIKPSERAKSAGVGTSGAADGVMDGLAAIPQGVVGDEEGNEDAITKAEIEQVRGRIVMG